MPRKSNTTKTQIGNLSSKQVNKKGESSHQSAWFLTINSNVRFEDNDPNLQEFAQIFTSVLDDDIFADKETSLQLFKKYGAKSILDYETLRWQGAVEKSPDTQTIHVHGIVLLIHRSSL